MPNFKKGNHMQKIEYRGELLSGYIPDLPINPKGRSERLRPFCLQNIMIY